MLIPRIHAFTTSMVVQESSHHTGVLDNRLLNLLGVVSCCFSCTFSTFSCPKAREGFSDEWRRVGHPPDDAEFDILAFVLVDAFGVVDSDFIEGAIGFGTWSQYSEGSFGFRSGNLWFSCHIWCCGGCLFRWERRFECGKGVLLCSYWVARVDVVGKVLQENFWSTILMVERSCVNLTMSLLRLNSKQAYLKIEQPCRIHSWSWQRL